MCWLHSAEAVAHQDVKHQHCGHCLLRLGPLRDCIMQAVEGFCSPLNHCLLQRPNTEDWEESKQCAESPASSCCQPINTFVACAGLSTINKRNLCIEASVLLIPLCICVFAVHSTHVPQHNHFCCAECRREESWLHTHNTAQRCQCYSAASPSLTWLQHSVVVGALVGALGLGI